MSTDSPVPLTPRVPANPARGNLRGQTTLAAKINRWQVLVNNLGTQIDQVPGLKDQYTQFQALLANAETLRDQLMALDAKVGDAMSQRNQVLESGSDLYTRLILGLKSVHGPSSARLREFGLKPRTGRPRKGSAATPPPVPEAHAASIPTAAAGVKPA
ncbi:MAG TPA: hypothetical protein VMM92_08940 [Thermoanaerobaculia bacterium]|nr:hypothetical protein [Thermoanaerobaculia bacterium]